MLLPDPDRLTGLIKAGKGCSGLTPSPDPICDKTCLEALGKLSKSRLFLPSGRHVALLGGFLPLLLFYSRASCPPCCSEVLLFPPSPSPPSSFPPRRCMCAGRRPLHAPGSAASNRYRSRAPKKGWPAVMVPVHPHPSIPAYRVRVEATARAAVLHSGRGPGKAGRPASPALQLTFLIGETRALLTILQECEPI